MDQQTGRSGTPVTMGQLELRFLVDETQGAGGMVMFEFLVPEAARVPVPHHHVAVDEAIYGLDGVMTSTVDGARHEIRGGDVLFIPRGAVHHHANLHPGTARVLVVLTPGAIGRRYFEEMAAVVNAGGPPDPATMRAVMLKHGLVPVAG